MCRWLFFPLNFVFVELVFAQNYAFISFLFVFSSSVFHALRCGSGTWAIVFDARTRVRQPWSCALYVLCDNSHKKKRMNTWPRKIYRTEPTLVSWNEIVLFYRNALFFVIILMGRNHSKMHFYDGYSLIYTNYETKYQVHAAACAI